MPKYQIGKMSLSGFRAYLVKKEFDFGKKPNMAIFAPNGFGKSSFIDGLEFALSAHGTLERLGLKAVNNQAGPSALAHNLASDSQIVPQVEIEFRNGNNIHADIRDASTKTRAMPDNFRKTLEHIKILPIVRGFTLRTFVENQTPEQRYSEIAKWLQLAPLVIVQKNLRSLRTKLNAASKDNSKAAKLLHDLNSETNMVMSKFSDAEFLKFVNSTIIPTFNSKVVMTSFDKEDDAYKQICKLEEEEEKLVGLTSLRLLHGMAETLYNANKSQGSTHARAVGRISEYETAEQDLSKIKKSEEMERNKAATAMFESLWNIAEPIFNGDNIIESCPICDTPINQTTIGSQLGISEHITNNLKHLSDYAAIKQKLYKTTIARDQSRSTLLKYLKSMTDVVAENDELTNSLKLAIDTFLVISNELESSQELSTSKISADIQVFIELVSVKISDAEKTVDRSSLSKIKNKIDSLFRLNLDHKRNILEQDETRNIIHSLDAQISVIHTKIRNRIQGLLDQLQAPMNEFYKYIQGDSASTIKLVLPKEEDRNQERLNLVIDFAENRENVQPSGYLSDSQIHSVALSLQLAAIRQFNQAVPILALDDVVTSYDAEHRRSIASLLAQKFSNFQIFITTHDERFFCYLKDQLPQKYWQFKRILKLDPNSGPVFADHKVTPDLIYECWENGRSAANEIRQAEEEWLLRICRDFGTNIRIRSTDRAHSYDRGELASSLASFLKKCKLTPRKLDTVKKSFLESLQMGVIENFGSHFQDNPNASASIGDERVRWSEFVDFTNQFICHLCGGQRFMRPFSVEKPICAKGGCAIQFQFTQPDITQ